MAKLPSQWTNLVRGGRPLPVNEDDAESLARLSRSELRAIARRAVDLLGEGTGQTLVEMGVPRGDLEPPIQTQDLAEDGWFNDLRAGRRQLVRGERARDATRRVQRLLQATAARVPGSPRALALPAWGADGDFGEEMASALAALREWGGAAGSRDAVDGAVVTLLEKSLEGRPVPDLFPDGENHHDLPSADSEDPEDGSAAPGPHADEHVPGLYRRDDYVPGHAVFTFDDGPHVKNTPEILDILAEFGVKATFFVAGKNIRRDTFGLVKRMHREGHLIANHTYTHDTKMARRNHAQGADFIEREFALCQYMVDIALLAESPDDFAELHRRVLGTPRRLAPSAARKRWDEIATARQAVLDERSQGRPPLTLHYSRPPGGAPFGRNWSDGDRRRFADALVRQRLLNVMWNASSGDSDGRLEPKERFRTARLVGNVMRGFRKGAVVLMHDRIPPKAVRAMLEEIGEHADYRVVTLDTVIEQKYGSNAPTIAARAIEGASASA